jgi:hypothetical protein
MVVVTTSAGFGGSTVQESRNTSLIKGAFTVDVLGAKFKIFIS